MIIDGKKISQKILKRTKNKMRKGLSTDPKLVAIMVGDDKASEIYIKQKQKAAEQIGIEFELIKLSSGLAQRKIEEKVEGLSHQKQVSGLIVQLPLPKKFNAQKIIEKIPPEKDVDILTEKNLGSFYKGNFELMPPTVKAITEILKEHDIKVKGKNIALVGTGNLVGYPLSLWLFKQKATVIAVNEYTPEPQKLTSKAETVISGVGLPGSLKPEMVKKDAVVIDAGIARVNNEIKGDALDERIRKKASLFTPVPGGVGPITVACLLENLVKLHEKYSN